MATPPILRDRCDLCGRPHKNLIECDAPGYGTVPVLCPPCHQATRPGADPDRRRADRDQLRGELLRLAGRLGLAARGTLATFTLEETAAMLRDMKAGTVPRAFYRPRAARKRASGGQQAHAPTPGPGRRPSRHKP